MKTITNTNARSLDEAVELVRAGLRNGRAVSFAGGGTDLLQLVKDRRINRPGLPVPDYLISLRSIPDLDRVTENGGWVTIGGMTTLDDLGRHQLVRDRFTALAQAAESVASPQIRNAGTLAGNVAQRPWCWYYRNGFNCYKAGGDRCYSITGENQLHAIFGGGPSYIVHPSDTAPALVAFEARFRVVGPDGERTIPSAEFFVLPREDAEHENVLSDDEILVSVELPVPRPNVRSAYFKAMDRETWTHALSSAAVIMEMDGNRCRDARIVLGGVAPTPWRVEAAERALTGQQITAEVARRAGQEAVAGARPLSKNAYKVALTQGIIERTVLTVAGIG